MSRSGLSLGLAFAVGVSSLVVPTLAPVEAHVNDGPPPSARPGECYGRVVTPPVYGRSHKQILEREGWTETRRGAAVVERVTRKVLVRPARSERARTPAVYKTVVHWRTQPGARHTVREPARYRIVTEKVMVEPARSEWRLTSAPLAYGESRGQSMLQATGEVYCRVLIPARYEHIQRRIKIAPARTYSVEAPPRKVKTVERVVVKPAGFVTRTVPAVYRTEVVKKVVRPGKTKVVRHPPVYRSVDRPALIRPPGPGWAKVVCGGEINPAFMAEVQQALIASGYDPGPPNGAGTPQTYAALRMYQRDHRLAQGQLTVESARALGVL